VALGSADPTGVEQSSQIAAGFVRGQVELGGHFGPAYAVGVLVDVPQNLGRAVA
jgi:hypothetical protein